MKHVIKYKYLIELLVKSDFKRKYNQSILGATWLIIEPLLYVLCLSFIFQLIDRKGPEGVPYPTFFYIGVLVWNFVSSSFTSGADCFIHDRQIIKKSNFPRIISPIRSVSSSFFEFLWSLLAFIPIAIYFKAKIEFHQIPIIIYLTFLMILLNLSLTIILGIMNLFIRDIGILMKSIKPMLFWFTPVVFNFSSNEKLELINYINPISGIISNFRNILIFERSIEWNYIYSSTLLILITLLISFLLYKNLEGDISDAV